MALLPAASLEAVMAQVMALLHDRAFSQDGLDLLLEVYRVRRTDAEELLALLLNGSLPMPQVEVLASGAMGGALGGYSPIGTTGTATIYLADTLLGAATPDGLRVRVLLEEIGHHLDHLLHGGHDSPGDEGDLFARLVLGEELTSQQKAAIRQADDSGQVNVHGVLVAVEQAALVGTAEPETLTGTGSADTYTGNGGLDTYMVASGGTPLSFSGSGTNGSVSGYDTITDYQPPSSVGGSGEVIGYATTTVTVVANGQGSGTASTLLLRNNKPIRSYAVSNGIIRFDSNPIFKSERPIATIGELAAAAQFLTLKDFGPHGAVVAFRATISGVDQSFVWIQGHDAAASANSVLIALPGVTATAVSASGSQIRIVDGLAPGTTGAITSVIDDLGSTTGTVPSGGSTDDTSLVLNGSLSAPLGPGETLRVFDGTSDLGGATASGTSWTFSDPRSLNGGQSVAYRVRVADSAGNLGALSSTYSVTITSSPPPDTTAPRISSVSLSAASGAQNGILNAGDLLTMAVVFSEVVSVTGLPQLALTIGSSPVLASYSGGTGSSSLLFTTTIQAGQNDADGISIPANAIVLNGGTIRDGAGNNADLTHAAVAANAAFLVDTSAPAAPVLALQSGSGTVSVSGLEAGATWRYSSTGGAGWSVDQPATTSSFTLSPGTYTAGQVQVIQSDRAGNSSAAGQNAGTYTVSGTTSPGASFSFSSFSGATGLQLNGNASLAGSLQLTPAQGNQRGSAFYAIPLAIQAETSFSSQFQIAITGGSSGADGLTFVIQNTGAGSSALGGSGSGLGYGSGDENVPAIDRSLAIEIDTYQNSWDFDSNHVAVLQGGTVQTHLAQKQLGFDANSGTPINVWLDYLGGSIDSLKVFLSTSATKPTTADLQLSSIDLPTILGNQAYVGFTAGTGGLSNAHAVNSWSFSSSTDTASLFQLADVNQIFVSERAGQAIVKVERTGGLGSAATVEYTTNTTAPASALPGSDYSQPGSNNTGTVLFSQGQGLATIAIPILNDSQLEDLEIFAVGLQNPSIGALRAPRTALVRIVDDEGAAEVSLASSSLSISEDSGTAELFVIRKGDPMTTVTVTYTTAAASATPGRDYATITGTFTFAPGEISKQLLIPILDDSVSEATESFSLELSSVSAGSLGEPKRATISILDNDVNSLQRRVYLSSGLNQPIAIDWTPDGRTMFVAQKGGVVRVVRDGVMQSSPLIDLSSEVNDWSDRGMMGIVVDPNFINGKPYVYVSYAYDPPETANYVANPTPTTTDLRARDQAGNRPGRVVRLTVNPVTMVADPGSMVVILGTNSQWRYISGPDKNSTGDTSVLPSGIVNTANSSVSLPPADQIDVGYQDNDPYRTGIQNQNLRDYIAIDSTSHMGGDLRFGPDGFLYVSTGDGTSYNFVDSRSVRVQDLQNLSGKLLRLDTNYPDLSKGAPGASDNPYFQAGNAWSNQSKVYYYGFRNPWRFSFDPISGLPVVSDVGWGSWEEINSAAAGANFGWPYREGTAVTGGYSDLQMAKDFYANIYAGEPKPVNTNPGSPDTLSALSPLLAQSHGGPHYANAIMVGDFYNANTMIYGDVQDGIYYAATLDAMRQVVGTQVLASGIPWRVSMDLSPTGILHSVDLAGNTVEQWLPM